MGKKKSSRKKEKRDKRGGVDHLTDKQIKKRAEKRSKNIKEDHLKTEALYRTLLKEVPEVKKKFVEEGYVGKKPNSKRGTDRLISNLTGLIDTEKDKSKKTVSRIRRKSRGIPNSKKFRT
ncbi:MAG: hypothetical protein ACOCTT_02230, partial [archaeon]